VQGRLDLELPSVRLFKFSMHIITSTTPSLISYFAPGNISVGFGPYTGNADDRQEPAGKALEQEKGSLR
jgi:hypothetical protein